MADPILGPEPTIDMTWRGPASAPGVVPLELSVDERRALCQLALEVANGANATFDVIDTGRMTVAQGEAMIEMANQARQLALTVGQAVRRSVEYRGHDLDAMMRDAEAKRGG